MRPALLAVLLVIPAPLVGGADTPTPTPDPQAEHGEERPYIGVNMGSVTEGGTSITRVHPGTPAERAGLEDGDVILRIDETETTSPGLVAVALDSRRPGDTIALELLRDGERLLVMLELGVRPDDLELRRERADHVLEVLQLRPGLDVADIGCGSGWLAEAIAIELDGNGTVYAVEIEENHVDRLRRRALPGVEPILSQPGDVALPENSLDIAMLHDVASHIDDLARPGFYDSVHRALRPGGRLVIFGPHGDAEDMLDVLREHGFFPVDEEVLLALASGELDQRLDDGIVFRER